jgi:hypothetical protein
MLGWQAACTQVLESSPRLAMLSPGRIGSGQIAHRPEYLASIHLPLRGGGPPGSNFEMPVPVSMVSRRSDVSSYLVHEGIELGQHNIPRPITVRAVQLSPLSPERLPPLSVCGAGAEDWIA